MNQIWNLEDKGTAKTAVMFTPLTSRETDWRDPLLLTHRHTPGSHYSPGLLTGNSWNFLKLQSIFLQRKLSLCIFFSLFLTHTHTHTRSHAHTHTLARTHTHTQRTQHTCISSVSVYEMLLCLLSFEQYSLTCMHFTCTGTPAYTHMLVSKHACSCKL